MTRREKLVAIIERFAAEGRSLEDLRANVVEFKERGGSGLVNYVNDTYASLDATFSSDEECAPQNEALVQAQAALEQAQAAIAGALSSK